MLRRLVGCLFFALAGLAPVAAAHAAPVEACGEKVTAPDELAGRLKAICGFNLHEDFDMTPDGRDIVVGDLGMEATPQGVRRISGPHDMSVIDTATDQVSKLDRVVDGAPGWGDPACRRPDPNGPYFVIGVTITSRAPGVMQLTVNSHSDGDRIEFYQLIRKAGGLTAAWRGCVDAPKDGVVDSVTPLPDGGFVASIIYGVSSGGLEPAIAASERGENTGWLIKWEPKGGVRRLPNSDARLNNGVAASDDGGRIYMAATGTRQLKVYSLRDEKFVSSVDLAFAPDNVKKGPDGSVIVSGTSGGRVCLGKSEAECTNGAWALAWNPRTDRRDLLFHAGDGLLSGTTAALVIGDAVYVTSFSDPYILKVAPRR
jgi:hypothetical protein